MNSSKRIFQGFCKKFKYNLVHDFWENCFRKPKLLSAANRLIYLNISVDLSKIHAPRHTAIVFYIE